MSTPVNKPRMFKVISPIEKKDGSTFWMRVGTGYPNKDQSINLYLDAIPFNHKLQLREVDDEDLQPRGRKREDGAPSSPSDLPF
ncbi:MAG TPA: hypothetical protein VHE35_14285 [Kofleriaceae bacterium]|nr:hypothetical protein [Kofleriaceae bacterium]